MAKTCLSCKWGVVGAYSKIYKGCPVGCCQPQADKQYKTKGGFQQGCYEPKEEKKHE